MVHDTPSRLEARRLKDEAVKLTKEAQALRQVIDMEAEVWARKKKAAKLQKKSQKASGCSQAGGY